MKSFNKIFKFHFPLLFLLALNACATHPGQFDTNDLLAYIGTHEDKSIQRHLPIFIIENSSEGYNHIGTPSARKNEPATEEILVVPSIPTIYAEKRYFQTKRDSYTNLIYRIHFPEIPFSLVPFYLGWGKNIGVIVVVTLNSKEQPVLYTTVQTCGCYLAFFPTSYLLQDSFPDNWNRQRQSVYGEKLPGLLDFKQISMPREIVLLFIRRGVHRIQNIVVASPDALKEYKTASALVKPLRSLTHLPLSGDDATSFYETSGPRKGYVKGSSKPWERLLMSWWALDWHIGQDKEIGKDKSDGTVFYTSLKPWARDASDMRNFAAFLQYWGWNL